MDERAEITHPCRARMIRVEQRVTTICTKRELGLTGGCFMEANTWDGKTKPTARILEFQSMGWGKPFRTTFGRK